MAKSLPHLDEWDEQEMNNVQSFEMRMAIETLERHFKGRTVYVSDDLPVAYDRADERRAVRPDIFVVLEIPPRKRQAYLPWKEGRTPDWVLEIASASTAQRDREAKSAVYQALGVREYVLFDPEGVHHPRILTLLSLGPEGYHEVQPGANGRLYSEVLDLEIDAPDYWEHNVHYWTLRFYRPGEMDPLPRSEELLAQQARRISELEERIRELEGRGGPGS